MRRFGFVFATLTIVVALAWVLLYNGGLRGWTTLRDPNTLQRDVPSWARCYRSPRTRSIFRLRHSRLRFLYALRPTVRIPPRESNCGMIRVQSPCRSDQLSLSVLMVPSLVQYQAVRIQLGKPHSVLRRIVIGR